MPVIGSIGRRHSIPIIYTRGTHYEVGFDVGRTFASLIQSFVNSFSALNNEYIPAYETAKGRQAYESTLVCVETNFPQYVEELQGTADGSNVPFYKLFLLHLDRIISVAAGIEVSCQPIGCSTICVNQENEEILGHSEDALSENLNHFYFVSAHITSKTPRGKWGTTEEKFTSLCYPGHLPGYTMNYNHHGLVFSINTLSAVNVLPQKTPRHFLTRALLSATKYDEGIQILKDSGCGAGDGCSINLTFLNEPNERVFYNIEMGPAINDNISELNITAGHHGVNLIHANKYLRLCVPELSGEMKFSSDARMCTLHSYSTACKKEDVAQMLSDQTNQEFPVFRDDTPEDVVKTIAVEMAKKPWKKNLYENQEYADNYTDDSFLKELRVNVDFQPVTLKETALGATLVVHELCTIIAFVLIYVYLYNEWTDPMYIFYCTSGATAIGFVIYRIRFECTKHTLGHDLQTVLIFLVCGQLFSPVLYTLTDTISTDTIYTMTFLMMLVHLIFFDYGVSAAIVSNSLSLSAAVFASICLSSRLASPNQAFILITVSIKCFVLFPLLRSKIKKSFCLTIAFVSFVTYFLMSVSTIMTLIFIFTIFFLNVICPFLFTKYQTYKHNKYGPWDEAIVKGVDNIE
ncbi:hypothetical protein FQA39_LY17657 [Lamprigera yunnana]|nr:hypothetical protein FQA39_LY17657 [Lamprigera yunnana]